MCFDSCCAYGAATIFLLKYMNLIRYIFISSLLLLAACSKDGDGASNIPEIPDDPNGTRTSILSRGGSAVYLDDTGNGISLAGNGALQGNNMFFTSSRKCDGLSYITSIPLSDWKAGSSAVLKKGDGLVVASRMFDGVTFTRLYVDKVDEVSGDVKIKSQAPFYGSTDKFYLNHPSTFSPYREGLLLYKDAGDTTVVIKNPTTYNVELASGEWVSIKPYPYVAHVVLEFTENLTGEARYDTLIFSNAKLLDMRLPIVQSSYLNSDFNIE